MIKKITYVLLLTFFSLLGKGNSYFVIFKNKNTEHLFNPYEYFDSNAIKNKRLMNLPMYDWYDLPVNSKYISKVSLLSDSLGYVLRWFNGVSVYCSETSISEIKQLSFVKQVIKWSDSSQFIPLGKEIQKKVKKILVISDFLNRKHHCDLFLFQNEINENNFSFKKNFPKKCQYLIGSKYALMVNSGSSANLLAFFSLINPAKKNRLKTGDECLVPALCWSTSLWPIVQAGLKPKFVDVDPRTLNLSIKDLKKKITKKTKAIMLVHVLGNSTDLRELNLIIKKKKLFLIEDTCESLGSRYKNKFLGTFGNFGTFSFYYSHQITAGEGGMIVCNDKKDYEILYSLRSHGWDRGLNNSKNDFNFVNSGFNLRPTDINAAIGYSQFKKLNYFKKVREDNKKKILKTLINSKKWNNQFTFIDPIKNLDPSWFGLPILINRRYISKKKKINE